MKRFSCVPLDPQGVFQAYSRYVNSIAHSMLVRFSVE